MMKDLTSSERTRLEAEFTKFDTDNNGTIEPAELMAAVRAMDIAADADRPGDARTFRRGVACAKTVRRDTERLHRTVPSQC